MNTKKHLFACGPVVGDAMYSPGGPRFESHIGQFLHEFTFLSKLFWETILCTTPFQVPVNHPTGSTQAMLWKLGKRKYVEAIEWDYRQVN